MCYHSDLANFQSALYAFVKSRVSNQSDAEDVVQNVNRVLLNKEKDYDPNYPFKGWAIGIAKWQILAYYKKEKRKVPLSSLDVVEEVNPNWLSDVPFASLIKKERAHLIKGLNRILSPRQKQVFNMLMDGFSQQEISEVIGTSKINVQVLKTRLIERIRKFVTNNNDKYINY
jgi:RNA polymerase sigma-70 factor (ECF subfamily)